MHKSIRESLYFQGEKHGILNRIEYVYTDIAVGGDRIWRDWL